MFAGNSYACWITFPYFPLAAIVLYVQGVDMQVGDCEMHWHYQAYATLNLYHSFLIAMLNNFESGHLDKCPVWIIIDPHNLILLPLEAVHKDVLIPSLVLL